MAVHSHVLLLEALLKFTPFQVFNGECRLLPGIPQGNNAAADDNLVSCHTFGLDCTGCFPSELSHPGREVSFHSDQRLKHLPFGEAL
jgi:hypothetical protein